MNRNDWEAQVFASNMKTTARVIALVIGSFGNWTKDKTVEPGLPKVAGMSGCTRDTAETYVAAMVEQGWLRAVGTGQYNTTVYELCPVVADTTGILARTKRKMNRKSLDQLKRGPDVVVAGTTGKYKVAGGRSVADTSEGSCRTESEQLPKPEDSVADSTGMNLKNNLEEQEQQPTSPDAGAPVAVEDSPSPKLEDESHSKTQPLPLTPCNTKSGQWVGHQPRSRAEAAPDRRVGVRGTSMTRTSQTPLNEW